MKLGDSFITVTAQQVSLFKIIGEQGKVIDSAKEAIRQFVAKLYPTCAPTYEQYSSDGKALRAQCEAEELSAEYYRNLYAGAVMALWKKLPESQSKDAKKKAAQRALKKLKVEQAKIDAGLKKAPANWSAVDYDADIDDDGQMIVPEDDNPTDVPAERRGAPKGEVQEQATPFKETIEQYIARVGMVEVIEALTNLVRDSDVEGSKLMARTLAALGGQMRADKQAHKAA